MKIYEKPMAIIEKIEVEDVITTSLALDVNASDAEALKAAAGAGASDNVILFQW